MSSSKKGQPRPEGGAGSPSQKIEVIDIKNNITTKYNSISAAAQDLGINRSVISTYLKKKIKRTFTMVVYFQKSVS